MRALLLLPHLLAICIAIGYCLLSSQAIGNYQNHNGDYAQYLLHARNLLLGRPWSYSLESFAAVLPGFPLVLSPILYFFGLNFFAIACFNVFLIACGCILLYTLLYKLLNSRANALAGCLLLATNGYVLYFQQDAQPNIFFAVSTLAVFCVLELFDKSRTRLSLIALLILLPLPGVIRMESVALYLALLCTEKKISLWLRFAFGCCTFIPFGVSAGLRLIYPLGDYGVTSTASKLPSSFEQAVTFGEILLEVYLHAPMQLVGMWLGDEFSIITALFISLGLLGGIVLWRTHRSLLLFFLFFLGLLACFRLHSDVLPVRYFIPLTWVWVACTCVALNSLFHHFSTSTPTQASTFLALLLLFWSPITREIEAKIPLPKQDNYYTRVPVQRAFDFITEEYPEKKVGFYKPRIARLLLDERNFSGEAIGMRQPHRALRLFQEGGVMLIRGGGGYGNDEMYAALREECAPVRSRGHHHIFVKTPRCARAKEEAVEEDANS